MDAGRESLQRVPMREPLKGTRAHVEELLEASATAADLIDRLQG
jgi:proteasome accessory factor A